MKKQFDEDTKELREAFKLFSDTKGRAKPSDLIKALSTIEFDRKNPIVFKLVEELDTEENKDGITFDAFIRHINDGLGDIDSKENIQKIFDQFLDNARDKTITLNTLKRLVKELGVVVDQDELKEMFLKVSGGSSEINFDSFHAIMNRK
jgi:Ca2+-binding EF-hand superfamily protein